MSQTVTQHDKNLDPAKNLIGNLLRGVFAYLALTPMIFFWGLLLIILIVITLVSFEQAAYGVAAIFVLLAELTERLPFLERFAFNTPASAEAGVIDINNSNLREVIFGLYGYVAMLFVLLGVLLDLVRGPRQPRPLK